jgi:hypothetical protein
MYSIDNTVRMSVRVMRVKRVEMMELNKRKCGKNEEEGMELFIKERLV